MMLEFEKLFFGLLIRTNIVEAVSTLKEAKDRELLHNAYRTYQYWRDLILKAPTKGTPSLYRGNTSITTKRMILKYVKRAPRCRRSTSPLQVRGLT